MEGKTMGTDDAKEQYIRNKERRKRNRFKKRIKSVLLLMLSAVLIAAAVFLAVKIYDGSRESRSTNTSSAASGNISGSATSPQRSEKQEQKIIAKLGTLDVPDYVKVDLLSVGKARRGLKLEGIKNIVIHYTGNPGTTAKQNRSFFAQPDTEVCSHFVVGIDGEIIQCVPLNEQSAASNWRNCDTISIEVCHKKSDGKFSSEAYASVVKLTAWLCEETELSEKDVIRHHDITGKECPLYYVKHADEWETMKADIGKAIKSSK